MNVRGDLWHNRETPEWNSRFHLHQSLLYQHVALETTALKEGSLEWQLMYESDSQRVQILWEVLLSSPHSNESGLCKHASL